MKIASVLLAGGRSTRMGRDKAWMDLRGRPLWSVQWDKLQMLKPAQSFISCRVDQGFEACGLPLIYDSPNASSPLEALAGCLHAVKKPMLVLAVDLPDMSDAVLRLLCDHHELHQHGAVFQRASYFEPLCALYSFEMLGLLDDAIVNGNFALQGIVRSGIERGFMKALPLPTDLANAFFNTNTPEEWTQAQPQP